MKSFVALGLLGYVSAISQGTPPRCDVASGGAYVNFGCQTYGLKGGMISRLNCTETSPGIMPWTLRPLPSCFNSPCGPMDGRSSDGLSASPYTLRSGDGPIGSDPTSYRPGELNVLYLRVNAYDYKYRGLLGYARPASNDNVRVGDWEQPDPDLFFSAWTTGNACQGGLTHATARIKPYLAKLYWRAPPAGTGTVKFEFLIKQGDANTGAFFYPAKQLFLTEGASSAPRGVILAPPGANCQTACATNGGKCNPTLQQVLATGSGLTPATSLNAFDKLITPWFACDHMFATCENGDPIRFGQNDCTYLDQASCPPSTSVDSSCTDVSNPTTGSRFCNCEPDPCNPSPCNPVGGNCSIDTSTTGGVLTEASWRCSCNAGFGGATCNTLQPYCGNGGSTTADLNFPCLNGGTCIVGASSVSCDCTTSFTGAFTGSTCEIPPPCSVNPCTVRDTQATCQNIDLFTNRTFAADCQCSVGFSGPRCMTIDGCAIRNSNPATQCKNGGVCRDNPDDTDLVHTSSCDCTPPGAWHTGPDEICDRDVNECDFLPCKNGGVCVNLPGSYLCNCTGTGFGGVHCEDNTKTIEIDWCPSNPCIHSTACTECKQSIGVVAPCQAADFVDGDISGFHCTCEFGFSGKRCTDVTDFCVTNPCVNGICVSSPVAYPTTGYGCQCYLGWEKDATGACLSNPNDCPSNACANGGRCVDANNSFTCNCPSNWKGDSCREPASLATELRCPTGLECPPGSKCNGVGQFAACDVIVCVNDDSCPEKYACTGNDIPNSNQLYCKLVETLNNNGANPLSLF